MHVLYYRLYDMDWHFKYSGLFSLNLEFQESAEGRKSHVVNALLLARQTTSSKYQFTTSNICYNGNI